MQQSHEICSGRLRFYFRFSHRVSAQSGFISVGELDGDSINFMGTEEEKMVFRVLLTCLLQINHTDCFIELQDL